ncbi:MAG: zinc-dependent alcohol dehydrogenase family protein [Chloroflexota bacterium]|nr:zinc-dependent alcohol dehydrogenase family protein [Chloroflexota bacterium]
MRAVVVDVPRAIRVVEIPIPEPGPDEVLIRTGACGICGTDLHIIDGEFPPTKYPVVPGHEFGGEVVAIGKNVTGFKQGDLVGVDPTLNCGACYFCQRGMANLCERWAAVGITAQGGFAEYLAIPARTVYPLPAGMSLATASLIEPLSCVVRGFHRLHPEVGESYLVYGAGPMGLLNAQVARFNGASRVAIVDINQSRLDRARKAFGFDLVGTSWEAVRDAEPRGFDNVIEATGVTKVAERAIDAVKRRGKLLLFGVCPPGETAAYDAYRIYNEEITILGTMAVLKSYGPAIDILAAGAIRADLMITNTFPLNDFSEAVDFVRRGDGLKVQVGGANA